MVEFSKTLGGIRCASAMEATRGKILITKFTNIFLDKNLPVVVVS